MSSLHDAYAPYCGGGQAENFGGWSGTPPFGTSNTINISRPARPDYSPSEFWPLWYLGSGITSDGAYHGQTVFVPGAANGAPESPVYAVSAGSSKLSLSCTNCTSPTATAKAPSGGCAVYDVVVNT